jgi:hypothetical protein
MPKKNPLAVPLDKFFKGYAGPLRDARQRETRAEKGVTLAEMLDNLKECGPSSMICAHKFARELWDAVKGWWPVCLLRQAAKANDAEGYKRLLHFWLCALGIQPPENVLAAFQGTSGAPRKPETDSIVETWKNLDRPPLSRQYLAREVYKGAFTKAGAAGKKRMVDQCRRAVERRIPRDQIPHPIKSNDQTSKGF